MTRKLSTPAIAAPPVPGPIKLETDPSVVAEKPPTVVDLNDLFSGLADLVPEPDRTGARKVSGPSGPAWEPSYDLMVACEALGWPALRDRIGRSGPLKGNLAPETLAAPVPTRAKTQDAKTLLWLAHGLDGRIPSLAKGETVKVALLLSAVFSLKSKLNASTVGNCSRLFAALSEATGRVVYRSGEEMWLAAVDLREQKKGKKSQSALADEIKEIFNR